MAWMFTKGQSGTLDYCRVLDPPGNCWQEYEALIMVPATPYHSCPGGKHLTH
jgi:hypothetical protein